jgi:hypothetical protein
MVGRKPKSWDVEEVRAKLEREQGSAALQIVRDFEQRLDAEYSGSTVAIQWRGSSLRTDEHATLWPWVKYGGIFYYPPVCFRVDGKIEVPFWSKGKVTTRWNTQHDRYTIRTPFTNEGKRRELRDHLNSIPGIDLQPGNPNGKSVFDLDLLQEEKALNKLVEIFRWYVDQILPHEMPSGVQQELEYRRGMWASLVDAGGPKGVDPGVLRDLSIYGGAQGVWVDKARTSNLTEDATGVTVGLLHTGTSYADDLSDDGVLYHYPTTNRPRRRDLAEIDATKAAGRLGLPVFVITYPSPGSAKRDVHLGWVESWDDLLETFLITFGDNPPISPPSEPEDRPFRLVEERRTARRQVDARVAQQRFKFEVFQWYGERCAVCVRRKRSPRPWFRLGSRRKAKKRECINSWPTKPIVSKTLKRSSNSTIRSSSAASACNASSASRSAAVEMVSDSLMSSGYPIPALRTYRFTLSGGWS